MKLKIESHEYAALATGNLVSDEVSRRADAWNDRIAVMPADQVKILFQQTGRRAPAAGNTLADMREALRQEHPDDLDNYAKILTATTSHATAQFTHKGNTMLSTTYFENASSYKTVYAAACHISADQWGVLLEMADNGDVYFVHRVSKHNDTGVIFRAGLFADYDDEEFFELVAGYGLNAESADVIRRAYNAGFDAVHFDALADLLAFIPWYTDEGAKVIPLAYALEYMSYYNLTPDQQDQVRQDRDGTGDEYTENDYFVLNDRVYCMADFMRTGKGGMAEYGFIGVMGESNTSALFISLSDNNDFVNVVRVIG